jgi:hypothetical protein
MSEKERIVAISTIFSYYGPSSVYVNFCEVNMVNPG